MTTKDKILMWMTSLISGTTVTTVVKCQPACTLKADILNII